jgi:hypothetical protein
LNGLPRSLLKPALRAGAGAVGRAGLVAALKAQERALLQEIGELEGL